MVRSGSLGKPLCLTLALLLALEMTVLEVSSAGEGYELNEEPFPESRSYFDHYSSFSEMVAKMQEWETNYSEIVNLTSLGLSIEGRDIWGLLISNEPNMNNRSKPAVLFDGNHHAREWMTSEVVMYIGDFLISNYYTNETVRELVNSTQIWLIPKLNPDGFVYDGDGQLALRRSWRKNRRDNGDGTFGVDLNRNYNWSWEYGNGNTAAQDYHGTAPFSEPETRALRDLVLEWNISTHITYHSYSELILYPWGDRSTPAPDEILFEVLGFEMQERIPNIAGNGRKYDVIQSYDLYATYGDCTDWMYGSQGVISFGIELYPASFLEGGFYPPISKIQPVVEDNLGAALYLIEVAGDPWDPIVDLTSDKDFDSIDAGTSSTFRLTIQNNAYRSAIYGVNVSGLPSEWEVTYPSTVGVGARGSADFDLTISPPWYETSGNYSFRVDVWMLNYPKAGESRNLWLEVNEIVPVPEVDVQAPASGSVNPGETVPRSFTVTNLGNIPDTYNLSVTESQGWNITYPDQISLQPGQTEAVDVEVKVPGDAVANTVELVTLHATSQTDGNVTDFDSVEMTVRAVRELILSSPEGRTGLPGEVLTYNFSVSNWGNIDETVLVEAASSSGWNLTYETQLLVNRSETVQFNVTVSIPDNALAGEVDTLQLSVFSSEDQNCSDAGTVLTSVGLLTGLTFEEGAEAYGEPGEKVPLNFTLQNSGNSEELLWITARDDLGWNLSAPSFVSIPAFSSTTIEIYVDIPPEAYAGTINRVHLNATSSSHPGVEANITANVTVLQVYGVDLTLVNSSLTLDPYLEGLNSVFELRIRNAGNGPDSIMINGTAPSGWILSPAFTVAELDGGETATLNVYAEPDPDIPAGVYHFGFFAISSSGVKSYSSAYISVKRPEIEIIEGKLSNTTAVEGKVVTVSFVIRNVGNGTASDVDVYVFLDHAEEGSLIFETTLDLLSPGDRVELSTNWTAISGNHSILILVDPYQRIVQEKDLEDSIQLHILVSEQKGALIESWQAAMALLLIALVLLILLLLKRRRREVGTEEPGAEDSGASNTTKLK